MFDSKLGELRMLNGLADLCVSSGMAFLEGCRNISKLIQWRSQPKNLGRAKKFLGAKMYDFRRITLFCLEKRLSKYKMTMFSKNN